MDDNDATELFRHEPHDHIDVGGAEVALRTVGAGPDVLFVHGWPVHGATFRKLLPHLVDHVTCHVIDLPGTGSSRFGPDSRLTIGQHIASVGKVVDAIGVDQIAVVGFDSGGMIARHAMAGDPRLRAMGLINTEQSKGLNWRFRLFLASRRSPGLAAALGWVAGQPRIYRHPFVFGDAFADRSHLDDEFHELFLEPIHTDPAKRMAAAKLLRSFDVSYVEQLADVHRRIEAPVQLVWGAEDKFFPLAWAEEMVGTFPDARLEVVPDAGLFSHEERPAEVAKALLPVLTGAA